MLVNFSLESLGTEIKCDKVSSDGYEPANLLHFHRGWGQHGFLAERFIKPPVTITLTFPCPIQISHIIVDPQVGSQRSSSIEIYTAVCSKRQGPFKNTVSNPVTNEKGSSGTGNAVESTTSMSKPEPVFKRVGFIHCSEAGCICFSNPSFSNSSYSTVTNCVSSYPHRTQLHHHQSFMLNAADCLSLRIVGTISSSVAAIRQLEVWGEPARSCPQQVRENIFQKFTVTMGIPTEQRAHRSRQATLKEVKKSEICDPCRHQLGDRALLKQDTVHKNKLHIITQSTAHLSQTNSDRGNLAVPEVPDEFFDALTCEIMSTPMLLPSGHSIDVLSLERFSDAEATYGRPPSDPFTGLSFTATRKPVLNETLKMRIDRFLSEHSSEPSLQNVPRALGMAPKSLPNISASVRTQESILTFGNRTRNQAKDLKHKLKSEPQVNEYVTPQHTFDLSQNTAAIKSTTTSGKKKKIGNKRSIPLVTSGNCETVVSKCSQNAFRCETALSNCEQPNSLSEPPEKRRSSSNCSSGKLTAPSDPPPLPCSKTNRDSHEERLQSSLHSSLFAVLRNLPAFTTQTNQHSELLPADSPQPDQECSTCRSRLGQIGRAQSALVYKLPCKHLICRSCLIKIDSKGGTCLICHLQFVKDDVIRTHI